jgi:hypothetical protein
MFLNIVMEIEVCIASDAVMCEATDAFYSFEGFQCGFLFSANAFRPSRAFSPDCRGSLNRSIVN